MRHISYIAFTVALYACAGCNIDKRMNEIDQIAEKVADEIDESIEKLENESGDWKIILKELEGKLNDDASRLIRGEITNLLGATLSMTGVEVRCNADFLRQRVKQTLASLKGQVKEILNGQPYKPQYVPYVCKTVPESIDLDLPLASRRSISYYGFNMSKEKITAVAIVNAGNPLTNVINLSEYLVVGTPYLMTLDLSRLTIMDSWRQIEVRINDEPFSTISVLAKPPMSCEAQRHVLEMNEFTFVPKKTKGDKDFDGNGPKVTCKVEYLVHSDRIDMKVHMKARETKSDWTTVEETLVRTIVYAPSDRKIIRIEGGTTSKRIYTDSDHNTDKYDETGQQPVRRFVFTGDTDGNEAGTKTKVKLEFNSLVYFTKHRSCL